MSDEIIEELWRIKDSIAREHGNDVRKLAAYLRDGKRREHSWPQVRSSGDILHQSQCNKAMEKAREVIR